MNIRNFRDISGYTNKDGRKMKANMIFRGGALDHLTPEDEDSFENTLGIRHIVDFRDEKEANLSKDYRFDFVSYELIPALKVEQHDDSGFDFEKLLGGNMNAQKFQYVIEYLMEGYKAMPFDNPAYRRLFELLLKNDGHVYFHCTAGKDRTGIAGFLIMLAMDMSEEDAIREYLLSNKYLKMDNDGLSKQLNIPEEYRKLCEPLLFVQEDFIRLTIDSIKQKYETYDSFFEKEYGLDRKTRDKLIRIYCE